MGILDKQSRVGEDVERRIRDAIASMKPLLRMETVGVELVRYESETRIALLRIEGDCPDCHMNAGVLRAGIEAHLRRRVPEIREVRTTDTSDSPTNG